MNPLIARITSARSAVRENAPVPCAMTTTAAYRARLRSRRDKNSDMQAVLGETREPADAIPSDAEELDPMERNGGTITAKLDPIKDVVQEPTKPKTDDDKFTSPYTALTAPDATPDSLTQADPSTIPGISMDRFSTKDASVTPEATVAPAEELSAPSTGENSAMHTMDVLLGRKRVGTPPRKPEEFQQTGAITTEAQALAQLNISTVSGEMLLGQGQSMPDPVASDGKALYESARRFI